MKKQNVKPPFLAEKFFSWYGDNAAIEDLHGDLDELFYMNLERMSVTRAKFIYCMQVISLLCSYAIRKRKRRSGYTSYKTNQTVMISNYLKVALRNVFKRNCIRS